MLKTALAHRAEISTELIFTVLKRISQLFLLCVCFLVLGYNLRYLESQLCFTGLSGLYHITQAGDLLQISHLKFSLTKSIQFFSKLFERIGLISFNAKRQRSFQNCGLFSVKIVPTWLRFGISVCSSLSPLCSSTILEIRNEFRTGYAKVIPDHNRYSRKVKTLR